MQSSSSSDSFLARITEIFPEGHFIVRSISPDGDFLIIGKDETETLGDKLPPTASYGPDEKLIRIPRKLLVKAKHDIPGA